MKTLMHSKEERLLTMIGDKQRKGVIGSLAISR